MILYFLKYRGTMVGNIKENKTCVSERKKTPQMARVENKIYWKYLLILFCSVGSEKDNRRQVVDNTEVVFPISPNIVLLCGPPQLIGLYLALLGRSATLILAKYPQNIIVYSRTIGFFFVWKFCLIEVFFPPHYVKTHNSILYPH